MFPKSNKTNTYVLLKITVRTLLSFKEECSHKYCLSRVHAHSYHLSKLIIDANFSLVSASCRLINVLSLLGFIVVQ